MKAAFSTSALFPFVLENEEQLQYVISNPLSQHGVRRYSNKEIRLYQLLFEAVYKKGIAAAMVG